MAGNCFVDPPWTLRKLVAVDESSFAIRPRQERTEERTRCVLSGLISRWSNANLEFARLLRELPFFT
jgi:hypothetical protein